MTPAQRVAFTLRFLAALSFVHGSCSAVCFAAFLLTSRGTVAALSAAFLACALLTAGVHQRVNTRAEELFREAEARGVALERN